MHLGKKALFLSVIIFASFVFTNKSSAVNTGTAGILPGNPDPEIKYSGSWFIYNLDLGKSKNDSIRIINNKSETIVAKLYAADATTTSDGSFALLSEEAPREDVGSWVKLAADEIEVPPNSEKSVPFTITIPGDADVGDHMGGIIMQEVEGEDNAISGTGVKIITRVGVRIYETVPGEVKKDFEITRFDWRPEIKQKRNFLKDILDINKRTAFIVGLKNKGNVRLTPKATIEVRNIFGKKVADLQNKEIGNIFPGKSNNDATIYWESVPFFGRYKATLAASFFEEGVGSGTREIIIWAFPYRIAFLLVLAGILFYLIRLTTLYFREAKKEKMPIHEVRDGETLGALAQKFGVPWKWLAKANGIRKPFEVRAGQKLFIPMNKHNIDLLIKLIETGQLNPPIKGKSGASQRKRKLIILIVVLAVLAGAFLWHKYKNNAEPPQTFQQTERNQEIAPQESQGKTASGAFKKSNIKVGIFTPPSADPASNIRLFRKLSLVGYDSETVSDLAGRSYDKTTIEYASQKKSEAELVKSDLGTIGDVSLQEIDGLEKDIVIYNLIKKEDLPELGAGSDKVSLRRDTIKAKVIDAGAGTEATEKIKTLIYEGGFAVDEEVGESQNKDNQGSTIIYLDDGQKEGADELAAFLGENGYQAAVEKKADAGSQEELLAVFGKI
jgi:LysM repeat protein